jgi:hypothetical protein
MSPSFQNELDRNRVAAEAEKTLRMIATLSAPAGIETRVKGRLSAPHSQSRVIEWPFSSLNGSGRGYGSGMRAAAAAAIVLIVAGGGWGVYSHIHVAPVPTAVVAPQSPNRAGGFSAAEARRTPKTLVGPAVPVQPAPTQKHDTTKVAPALHRNSRHRAITAKTAAAPVAQ